MSFRIFSIFIITQLHLLFQIIEAKVLYSLVGGITDTSVKINLKGEGKPISVFLNGTIQNPINLLENGDKFFFSYQINNLTADTKYELYFEENGVSSNKRYFKTFSNLTQPAVFNFIVSSYSKLKSSRYVYQNIIDEKPDFFMVLGDIHNEGLNANKVGPYEDAFTTCIIISLYNHSVHRK